MSTSPNLIWPEAAKNFQVGCHTPKPGVPGASSLPSKRVWRPRQMPKYGRPDRMYAFRGSAGRRGGTALGGGLDWSVICPPMAESKING